MSKSAMTSLDRVFTTMEHREPDRVPQFLATTMTGARQLGMTIPEYFSRAENVVEGQLRMQRKFRNDCYIGFLYGPLEIEAFGGEVLFTDNGPPNSGTPFISDPEQITRLEAPDVGSSPVLRRSLDIIRGLKEKGDPTVPVLGVAISPYSLPVMQMGFPAYLDLMTERPDLFQRLLAINEEFCVAWANAQFDAGITALTYFDPLASPTNIRPEDYRKTGKEVARRVLPRLKGPAAVHLASGRVLKVVDDIAELGTPGLGTGDLEDAAKVKAACKGRLTMLGNLNGIEMCRWTADRAEKVVKELLAAAAPGGGFILCDGHGELPWQVSDDIILAVSEAIHTWGRYPLDWIDNDGT
jgi:uroporphyrinogen decarboxylase